MNAMALPFLITLACVLLELWYSQARRGVAIPWRDVILNLNSGHILMWFFRGIEVVVFAWILAHFSLHWLDRLHPAAVWLFAILAWDLGFYWMHRLHHSFAILWAVHVVHHEGEHFNLSLGIRNSWYSSLTTLPFTSIPLALVGVPLEVFIAVSTLHYTVQFYNHNGIVGRSGWLDRFLVTPANHRVHHGHNREYRDRNFGGTFLIWDKLFGTLQRELPGVPIEYGVATPTQSTNPFWANTVPVLRYLGLRVPSLNGGQRLPISDTAIATGGLLLFGIVTYYVHRNGTWPGLGQPVFFALIFAATLALGGMSDGRRWGVLSWLAIAALSLSVMPLCFGLRDPLGLSLLAALLVHSIVAAAVTLRLQEKTPPYVQT
ncbi:sterol desaturase family protein [Paraburkholderia phenazinium]|jgi:sterol desaturase/sphingolipid hydroxylase (fatty acid hydroxylase superfamily)|uniref:Sterol desaturase/sphingolipid hydroxylase, fatty acid hydroxylase superfamily n=1 Tax=Paraburkholderia phenazinium TaxID=60549 RepID=A0A1G8MF62_9BURK|nr:sterol desaturase family protein [Paraburkholderia phenazinium]SDI66603.1 Sterol desaturase/sphingolipid hydroxylase, fatty acid hydroxylase superfamily [Paraburkholderia phenazinium]